MTVPRRAACFHQVDTSVRSQSGQQGQCRLQRPQHATEGNNRSCYFRSFTFIYVLALVMTLAHAPILVHVPWAWSTAKNHLSIITTDAKCDLRHAHAVGLEVTDLFIIGGCVEPTKQQPINNVNWNNRVSHRPIQRKERVPNAYVIFWAERTFGTRTVK